MDLRPHFVTCKLFVALVLLGSLRGVEANQVAHEREAQKRHLIWGAQNS